MRTLRPLAQVLWIFVVITIISATQSDSDPREVVQASDIMKQIKQGEPVNYVNIIIEGDIDIGDLKLPVVPTARSPEDIKYLGLSKNLTVVRFPLVLQDCLIDGGVNLSNARILAPASFSRSIILKEANFHGSEFYASADFSYSRFNHIANLIGSQFNESANFVGSRFNKSAKFMGSRFNEFADFRGSQFNKSANFRGSQFNKFAYFSSSQFNEYADFDQTKFLGDLSFEGSWIANLSLNQAEFGKIFMRWENITLSEYDETAYLSLIGNFKNLNFLEDADECYYDYRNDRRATLPLLYQPVDYALMLFYGYGVKPDRPVIWSLIFMTIFAALFWWRQGILPLREGEPEEGANRFSLLEAAAFSAMTFLSGGKLVFDPPEYRIASGKAWRDVQISKALYILERLLGMVLIIMFAIAVGKTIIIG
ncbi:MAG: pentapeptide repeat-containing protein [Methanothrix sp.]|nr:pentapeptide repeat-containing protein [Methanothrix sp.]